MRKNGNQHSADGETVMWFGIHKGKKFKDIPVEYFQFLLDHNISFKATKHYSKTILKLVKNGREPSSRSNTISVQ